MYLTVLDFVPTCIGIILLFVVTLLFIEEFTSILKKDRLKEVESIYRIRYWKQIRNTKQTISSKYTSKIIESNEITEQYEEIQEKE